MQRMTRQRLAVYEALDAVAEFRSAQELHEAMVAAGDAIGLATVYRTLQTLADNGEVDVLRTTEGEAVYRRCARREHHHHLMCRTCGHTVDIDGPTVESWCTLVGDHHGFTNIAHTIELFGTCSDCAAADRTSSTP